MSVKPTVALRALLVGGITAFAKIAGADKAAGGVKLGAAAVAVTAAAAATIGKVYYSRDLGAAAAAVTAAAGATMSGSKQDTKQASK
ncbi:hypothetical protein Tco_0927155 [Tanacetum coccineum]